MAIARGLPNVTVFPPGRAAAARRACGSFRLLKPPADADVKQASVDEHTALIAEVDVISLHGDVGLRVVGDTGDPGVAVELLQRQQARRHPELCIEVLVTKERHQIARRPRIPNAVPRFAIEAAYGASDVRRHTGSAAEVLVQLRRVTDARLGELAAQLQPAAQVPCVDLAQRHGRLQLWRSQYLRRSTPDRAANSQTAN